MKKLVVKESLNLGLGNVLKKGQIVEQYVCTKSDINESGIKLIKEYNVLVKGLGVGVFSEEEFNRYFEKYEEKQIKSENVHMKSLDEKVKVIRSDRATIVILSDGTKGVSKCLEEDTYDKLKGFEIAYTKACIKRLNKNLKELVK